MVLAAQVNEWGGLAQRKPITVDNFDQIVAQIQSAVNESDLVLVNAGSSAGSEDFTSSAVEKLGTLLVHGVAVRPGHPVIIGFVPQRNDGVASRQVPVIGVPGYPVSAALTNEIFVEPLIHLWLGEPAPDPEKIQASLTRKINSPAGDDDYVRVVVGDVGGQMLAAPLNRGAGVTTSLSKADGIVIVPRQTQGFEAGDRVEVRLYRPERELKQTIFTIGSHDMTLDVLTQALSMRQRRLVSANAGSMGGLIALSRHQAHFAGSHLLDTVTGDYNLSYIHKYLPDTPVHLFDWVERIQGLVVRKGNPKGIHGIEDLWRNDVVFINRQKGSGTRVLLDDAIGKLGKTSQGIRGYEREEYTHLGVAAAVSSGRADCGLAIAAAANALDLDFISLFRERYQLVIPSQFADSPLLSPLFDLMIDADFRRQIATMPGYKADHMGDEVFINSKKRV
jgi:putative molybdopterin biosynthesis protein